MISRLGLFPGLMAVMMVVEEWHVVVVINGQLKVL